MVPRSVLTAREMEVFRLLGEWHKPAEIARSLHISPKTVAVHQAHIREKLGCHSWLELLRMAVGWMQAQAPGEKP